MNSALERLRALRTGRLKPPCPADSLFETPGYVESDGDQPHKPVQAPALAQVPAKIEGSDSPTAAPPSPKPPILPAPSVYDAVDMAVLEWLEELREVVTLRPADAATRNPNVPEGWTADNWRERVQQLAKACESVNPPRAAELRSMAEEIE